MTNINKLSSEELRALSAGTSVDIGTERTPAFRAYAADNVVLIGQMPSYLTFSVQRFEPRDVRSAGVVLEVHEAGPRIEMKTVIARTEFIEDAQVRVSPDVGVDLAMALLSTLAPLRSANLRERIRVNPEIAALFSKDG